ncbi:hypothetical protein V5740_03290 [Croceibacterium sp. TMG7-5b_MA50]|uniref:hypothetical protein n=1 Tax=Croceibacterium sp. TMG7-5b_MA50 TaxID=3121290 RepID=UPI003221D700
MTGDTLEAVADGSREAPVAALNPRPHAVLRLVGILLPLMLRHGSEQVLDQLGVRVFAEFDRRRLQDAVGATDRRPELKVSL